MENIAPREFWIEVEMQDPSINAGWRFHRAWTRDFEMLHSAGIKTIHLIEKRAHDEALARIKSLENDYEGALSDMSEMKECIKLLEEVCEELMSALRIISNDLDVIGITPTEVSHLAISKTALESARQKLKGER